MPYRARQLLFTAVTCGPVFIAMVVSWWWVAAVDDDNVALLLRAGSGLAGAGLIVGVLHYWPTRRRPPRLYHLTTRAAADAATVDTHADGTVTVALRPRGRGSAPTSSRHRHRVRPPGAQTA